MMKPLSFILILAFAPCIALGAAVDRDGLFDPSATRRSEADALLARIERGGGFSDSARQYVGRLREFDAEENRLLAQKATGDKTADRGLADLANRRNRFLAEQVEQLGPIVFFTRHSFSRPNAANCAIWQSVPERWGCGIHTIDTRKPAGPAHAIFQDPEGAIYDMNLSYDAKTIFFSYRKKSEPCWQIYEIGVDGRGLKKISRDPNVHDVGAAELPDGRLVFVSTRCGGFTVCQPGPRSILHVMERDGSDVRCVSQNTLSDFSPQVLPDGRVLFTRWEYVDRDLTYRQSLWTQNPDGSHYQLFFGNTIRDVGVFWQSRAVPGQENLLVSTFAPHHGWSHGAIGLIDNRVGVEAGRGSGFAYLTPEYKQIGDADFRWGYRDPFPVNDHQFLVAYGGGASADGPFAIYLLDVAGNKTRVHDEAEIGCCGPILLRPTTVPPVLATLKAADTESAKEPSWGSVLVADVYQGLAGVERGRVKYIQVMEQLPKMSDLVNRAYDQSPLMSYATYYAKKCWGRAPVEADGSAHFRVPALREMYFQVLDAEGRELQRMTSALQLMPGEARSCIGCHEPRNAAPMAAANVLPLAARRRAVDLAPPRWGNDGVIDYCKLVQPVLDEYCIECHRGADPAAGYDLSGDKTRLFNMSYDNLLGRSASYRQHNMENGRMRPEEAAKGKPLVHFYWLLRTPTAVNQPLETGSHASRLLDYIDTNHCGRIIPLEARERIYAWIDANVPYYGTYAHQRPRSPGNRDLFSDVASGGDLPWFAGPFLQTFDKRCASCHGKFPGPNEHDRIWTGTLAWINLTHPEWSPALTAHLPKEAGGRGLSTEKGKQTPPLFKDKTDPDYTTMLKAIEEGHRLMLAHPREDMVPVP